MKTFASLPQRNNICKTLRLSVIAEIPILILFLGCPGNMSTSSSNKRDGQTSNEDNVDSSIFSRKDRYTIQSTDHAPLINPDLTILVDQNLSVDHKLTETPGEPCPCMYPLLCVKSACRKPCTQIQCNAQSPECETTELCQQLQVNTAVCMPALATTGEDCSAQVTCRPGNLCLQLTETESKCHLTCTQVGQPCGSGTCTEIINNPCLVCY